MKRKSKRYWSKSIGEWGCKVRLYEARPGGPIMRSIRINGKEDRKSLHHRNKDLAVKQAYQLLADLKANEHAIELGTLTLGMLAQLYAKSPAFGRNKARTQCEDAKKLTRVVGFLGRSRRVESLCESDVLRFIAARKRGDPTLFRVFPDRQVSERTAAADLVTLVTALNWAMRERNRLGQRLLKENPLYGVRLPKEKNPKRPLMDHWVFEALLAVAPEIDARLELALVVAEGTGRRISAWSQLRWDDVDFDAGTIRWRAETDKKGYEQVVPMMPGVRDALARARRDGPRIGRALVFPAPKNPAKPCDRHLLDGWLRKAFALAGLDRPKGGLWHTLRRKWATERKDFPIKDLAAAGGWRDTKTVLDSYQQTDSETIKAIVMSPRRVVGR